MHIYVCVRVAVCVMNGYIYESMNEHMGVGEGEMYKNMFMSVCVYTYV